VIGPYPSRAKLDDLDTPTPGALLNRDVTSRA
jgi:hypothetical protein